MPASLPVSQGSSRLPADSTSSGDDGLDPIEGALLTCGRGIAIERLPQLLPASPSGVVSAATPAIRKPGRVGNCSLPTGAERLVRPRAWRAAGYREFSLLLSLGEVDDDGGADLGMAIVWLGCGQPDCDQRPGLGVTAARECGTSVYENRVSL